ncbi:hypothetical protein ACVGXO_00070, partial [Enterobacter hormaechei]
MQAVGDQGMGVFVEHGVSFVRLLPGGRGAVPPPQLAALARGLPPAPPPKKIKKKKPRSRFFFFFKAEFRY